MAYIGKQPTPVPLSASDLNDDVISLAKMASGTDGNIISYDASGDPVAIATGNDGQILTSAGAGQPCAFEAGIDLSGTLAVAGVSSFAVAANVAQGALTSSSNAVAWDASAIPNAYHITTENTVFSAPSNAVEGAFICVEINYSDAHTIGWNTIFEFAASTEPTTTDTDTKTDLFVFRYNGAVWQEVGRTLNLSES